MDLILALGISIGVLAGIWGEVSAATGLVTWIGFLSWGSFYAIGGGTHGLIKTLPSNLSGVFWGAMIFYASSALNVPFILGISICIASIIMCVQSKWSVLSFIPGTFAGCASYFGSDFDFTGTCIALVAGALLGYISEVGGVYLSKIGIKQKEVNTENSM
ncbi:DUF1097 domain-containing protein [Peribacillus simplex]|uniref:DUF1097 domain-containing protein n=1 Tax=Peribacillus simplex TaxID=1478 RepID=UPI0010BEE087|nr:DUF1097 domain-containing protein [Peribacillus simplex]TKH03444.1 DUF1097 domain-containing protein [Peribacillus simplex]